MARDFQTTYSELKAKGQKREAFPPRRAGLQKMLADLRSLVAEDSHEIEALIRSIKQTFRA